MTRTPPTVLHLITGLEAGGAEGVLARLVAHADPARCRSVVVSMTDAGSVGPRIVAAGVPLETLGMRRGGRDPRGLLRLLALLRRYRPAIVQTWLYHADLLGLAAHWLGQAPVLLWNIRCSEAIEVGAVRGILRRCSGIPQAILINSMAGLHYHERLGYRPRRWEYVPNGFDTTVLHPDPAARQRLRTELNIGEAEIAIGLPARYHPQKDHATFIAAAARLAAQRSDVIFLLAGGGADSANGELMRMIAGHDGLLPRMRLLGERSDMPAVYAALDIATLSSAFGEGFPNVLAEAMACGVPCVATDSGDAAEIVGGTGEIVPTRDPEALAGGWERLVAAGAETRQALGATARQRVVECYDLEASIRRYEDIYAGFAERAANSSR